MHKGFLIILFTIFYFLTGILFSQDYSKMIELQEKMKKLMTQMSNSKTEAEATQIQKQIEALTKEIMLEGQKIEQEGLGTTNEAPTELLSQEEFTQKTLKDLEAKIKSLPKPLQEIYKLESKLDDLKPETDADEINDISNQIIDKMGKIYSGKIPVETDATGFITSIKFVKKGTLTCEVEGTALESDFYDLNYKMVVNMDVVWVADYTVDVLQKKGYLIAYSIDTYASETEPEDVHFPILSGTKTVIRIGQPVTKGPIDKYKFEPGYGYFQIAPTNLKSFDWKDTQAWPDEMVSEYTLSFIRPQVFLYSSMDDTKLSPYVAFPISRLSEVITPAELNMGIQKGEYSKTIIFNDPPGPALTTTLKIHLLFQPLICDEKGDPGAVAVSGACIDHGGYILTTEDNVFVNGKPVARVGDKVLCLRHGMTEIVGDEDVQVYSGKQRIARVGDKTKCGAIIMGGSFNVFAGEVKK